MENTRMDRAAGEVIEVVPNNSNGYKRSFMRLRTEPMMIPRPEEKRSPEEGGFPKRREGHKGTCNVEAIHVAQGSRGCMGNSSSMQECGDNRAGDSGFRSGKDIMRREVSLQFVWDHKLLSPIEMLRLSNDLINCWDCVREASTWIKGRNGTHFVIESHCSNVVFAINNLAFYDSCFVLMVIDCIDLLTTLVDVQVVHIRRFANQVTHKIVRAFGSLPGLHIWGFFAPDCILAELAHDLME